MSFKDVLSALSNKPESQNALGLQGSGYVARTGLSVKHLQARDRVMLIDINSLERLPRFRGPPNVVSKLAMNSISKMRPLCKFCMLRSSVASLTRRICKKDTQSSSTALLGALVSLQFILPNRLVPQYTQQLVQRTKQPI